MSKTNAELTAELARARAEIAALQEDSSALVDFLQAIGAACNMPSSATGQYHLEAVHRADRMDNIRIYAEANAYDLEHLGDYARRGARVLIEKMEKPLRYEPYKPAKVVPA